MENFNETVQGGNFSDFFLTSNQKAIKYFIRNTFVLGGSFREGKFLSGINMQDLFIGNKYYIILDKRLENPVEGKFISKRLEVPLKGFNLGKFISFSNTNMKFENTTIEVRYEKPDGFYMYSKELGKFVFKNIFNLFEYQSLQDAERSVYYFNYEAGFETPQWYREQQEEFLKTRINRRYIVDPVAGVVNNISNVVTDILDGGSRKRKSFRLSKKKSKVRSKRSTLSKRSRTRKARKSM
jgi:hypothetical protein